MADILSKLAKPIGATKKKTRKGRGVGSGLGKTAGRGQKGQYARNGIKRGFEGGQTPLARRLPKRGFNNPFADKVAEVNVGSLEVFGAGAKVDDTSRCIEQPRIAIPPIAGSRMASIGTGKPFHRGYGTCA